MIGIAASILAAHCNHPGGQGAHRIVVHVESAPDLRPALARSLALGAQPGIALDPTTPLGAVDEVITEVALILVMSVQSGFGGQPFIASSPGRIASLRGLLDKRDLAGGQLVVDGGIDASVIGREAAFWWQAILAYAEAARAGLSSAVVGSGLFASGRSIVESARALCAAASERLSLQPERGRSE